MKTETDKKSNAAGDYVYEGSKKEPYSRVIVHVIIALLFAGAGVYQFIRIQQWEITGGVIEMNDFQRFLYKIAGKWGIAAFLFLLSAVFVYKAYVRRRRIKMQERL